MTESPSTIKALFRELRRRRVFRVAVVYAVVSWIVIQVAAVVFPALALPSWTTTFVVLLAILGFPIALVLAWAFEITPEGVRRTALRDAEQTRPASSPRRTVAIVGSLLLVALVGWIVWGLDREPVPDLSESAVAVLPFSVQGSDEVTYLGEGMVSLLATKFDGAGELRSVDPRALLSHVQRNAPGPVDPESAREIAGRFGAGLYVMGDIVEVRGRLRINAAVYDSERGSPPLGEASVEGEAERVFDLVDEVTAQLLGHLRIGPAARVSRIAAVTTSSLPALKSYLEGESALRGGDYRAAVEAFEDAVRADSLFALGYYRLSIAAEWLTLLDLMVEASEKALEHADRLSERDRRLLAAFRTFRWGENRRAEELYRSILSDYPNDVEAWLYLGENLFHTNPYRGESVSEAWDPFARVIGYEPGNVGSLVHMIRIAAHEENASAVDSLFARYVERNPEGDRSMPIRALRASVLEDESAWKAAVDGLARSTGLIVALAIWDVGLYAQDLGRAMELAGLLADEGRSIDERARGHAWRAEMLAARGRWRAAERELSALEAIEPGRALEARAWLYLLPFAPVSREDLATVRDRLVDLDPAGIRASEISSFFFSAHDPLHPFIRAYLLGRISARLGEIRRARAYADELERLPDVPGAGTMPADLASGVRALASLEARDSAAARAEVDRIRVDVVYNYAVTSPYYSEIHERYLRAELLRTAGREREALAWYDNLVATATAELPYLAVSHLRRGQIHERLGDPGTAADHYARFVELWEECDPELRPLLAEGRDALARVRRR